MSALISMSFIYAKHRKSHQEQALDFMNQRENGPIPDDFRLWKSHDVEGVSW